MVYNSYRAHITVIEVPISYALYAIIYPNKHNNESNKKIHVFDDPFYTILKKKPSCSSQYCLMNNIFNMISAVFQQGMESVS